MTQYVGEVDFLGVQGHCDFTKHVLGYNLE